LLEDERDGIMAGFRFCFRNAPENLQPTLSYNNCPDLDMRAAPHKPGRNKERK
jgi:hypothetical protein